MNPAQVNAELRRRGIEVWTGDTVIGTDERLHEARRLANLGGGKGQPLRPRFINAGRLEELKRTRLPNPALAPPDIPRLPRSSPTD